MKLSYTAPDLDSLDRHKVTPKGSGIVLSLHLMLDFRVGKREVLQKLNKLPGEPYLSNLKHKWSN
ncbi:hypothetical protein KSS87_004913 [Heliosperma pusillum]|nr:hypothetical protein KSS87_004913 [Heliosperma pusillum]